MTNEAYGFDLKQAGKCSQHYTLSTGIRTIVIDQTGKTLFESTGNNDCKVCRLIAGNVDFHCSDVHLYGSYESERFGGTYIFFCPLGLVHWASPIKVDNNLRGAILAGPVQMVEPEDFLIEDIIKKHGISASFMTRIIGNIRKLPVIPTERVNALAELLFMVSSFLSDSELAKTLKTRDNMDNMSRISEFIYSYKRAGVQKGNLPAYPIDKEKKLVSAISLGDKAGAQELLNEILGHIFFCSGNNFDTVKARVLELVVLLSRASVEGGAEIEHVFGLNCNYLNQLEHLSSIDDTAVWLSEIMNRFTNSVFVLKGVKHFDIMHKAGDFIRKNHMKKITLSDVASYVHLSTAYLSKLFKEEMGTNFNAYLNRIRVENAKKLLLDENINIIAITNMVGFDDQSYFSKVFKRITGVTPGKYRGSRGQVIDGH